MLSGRSAGGKCFKRRVFNMADEDIERRRDLNFAKKCPEKSNNAAVCVAICSDCIGARIAQFLFLWRDHI